MTQKRMLWVREGGCGQALHEPRNKDPVPGPGEWLGNYLNFHNGQVLGLVSLVSGDSSDFSVPPLMGGMVIATSKRTKDSFLFRGAPSGGVVQGTASPG